MRKLVYLLIVPLLFISCSSSTNKDSGLLTTFGKEPSITRSSDGEVLVVFGNKESIYFSSSKNQVSSFSKPTLVANHDGLLLGHSSGPAIASTSTAVIITAPDRKGNLHAWSRPNDSENWSGPIRINDVDASVGEALSDITATPDGQLFTVWIDTRISKEENHDEHSDVKHKKPEMESEHKSEHKAEVDLNAMTPLGITIGELYKRIGDIPENSFLSFHHDSEEKLRWVLFDKDKNVLKAENLEEYKKFREINQARPKIEAKIYLASSSDDGKTWTKSKFVYTSPDGSVCECCKPSIVSDLKGNLTIQFRNNVDGSRDLHFITSIDGGKTFSPAEKLGTGTWKINGCPMDGGGLTVDKNSKLTTVWKRMGDVFISNSGEWEEKIGEGKSPSISSNDQKTYIGFVQGEDILAYTPTNSVSTKIGMGSSPKVIALDRGAMYFWVNKDGIHYKKVL